MDLYMPLTQDWARASGDHQTLNALHETWSHKGTNSQPLFSTCEEALVLASSTFQTTNWIVSRKSRIVTVYFLLALGCLLLSVCQEHGSFNGSFSNQYIYSVAQDTVSHLHTVITLMRTYDYSKSMYDLVINKYTWPYLEGLGASLSIPVPTTPEGLKVRGLRNPSIMSYRRHSCVKFHIFYCSCLSFVMTKYVASYWDGKI